MKAISIALVPTTSSSLQWLIEHSATLGQGEAFLNATDCYPHVTLGMGLCDEQEIFELIHSIREWPLLNLHLSSVTSFPRNNEGDLVWLNIDRSLSIQEYHERAMKLLPTAKTPVLPGHFGRAEELKGSEIPYVQSFRMNAFENYHPHITLGYGSEMISFKQRTIKFRAGVFHLGPSCTCWSELT